MSPETVTQPLLNLLTIVIAVVRVVGVFVTIKGVIELIQGINQRDTTALVGGGTQMAVGLFLIFLQEILNMIGITW